MRHLVWPALLLVAAPVFGQSRAATERRLGGLQEQIQSVQRQVRAARGEEATALRALEGLDTEIRLREELVDGYQTQVRSIRGETEVLQRSIARLETEIETAKDTYQARARHAYKHGRRNALALILAAGSINQMLVRARYLQQFASRRRRQVERIESKTYEMRTREQAVRASLEETQRLLQQSQVERGRLAERRAEREVLVAQVRTRRGRLETELQQRRSDASQLRALVADLRVRDSRLAEQRRREAAARAEAARQRERQAAADRAARAEAERAAEVQRRADAAARDGAARRAANRRPQPRTERPAPTPRRDALPPATAPQTVARSSGDLRAPAPSTTPRSTPPPPRRSTPDARRVEEPASRPAPRDPLPPVADAPPSAPSSRRTAPTPRTRPPTQPPAPEPALDRVEALTGSFRSNRGRLPWPASGTVTGSFGNRTDPVYGTQTTSQGIDIATSAGAPARAVFQGTVERVGAMASYGTFVLVSHGDFVTVYGNLSQVVVRQGQQLRAGEVVGRAGTASDRRGSSLFFALFQSSRAVNPVPWLRAR